MNDILFTSLRSAAAKPRCARNSLSTFGTTHPGRCRDTNDDAFRVEPSIGLMVVADGVATTRGGGTAARVVVDTVCEELLALRAGGLGSKETPVATYAAALRAALFEAHRRVREEASRSDQPQMATTVVALWCIGGHAIVMHAGDSRAYRWRGGALTQLTADHTMTAEYIRRRGSIPAELGKLYDHVITRAVSARRDDLPLDVCVEPLVPGDRFALCTDGLTVGVPDTTVEKVVGTCDERAAAEMLVVLANDAGGTDNITVAVARWE